MNAIAIIIALATPLLTVASTHVWGADTMERPDILA